MLQHLICFSFFPTFPLNQPLAHQRLHLEDPSSAPQLDPFVGSFSLATATAGPRTARAAAPEATAKVCRALEGYAMQGTQQQLAKELLMEAGNGDEDGCWMLLGYSNVFKSTLQRCF